MKKKTIVWGLLTLSAAAVLAHAPPSFIPDGRAAPSAADTAANTSCTKVRLSSGSLSQTVTSTGSLSYENLQTLKAPLALTAGKITLSAGDHVNAGDTLVTYDIEALRDSLEQAKADLILQDAEIASLADTQLSEAAITAQTAGM